MATVTENEIAQGLRNDEFILHYQPKASLLTNRIVGAEALARWRRPDGTLLLPGAFIPVAERSALIKQLTLRLLPQLIKDVVDKCLGKELCFSLNVSALDLEDTTLTSSILNAIVHHGLPPGALELEITETQALQGGQRIFRTYRTLPRPASRSRWMITASAIPASIR